MIFLEVLLTWVHLLCVIIFIGGMFLATFLLMPLLKTELEYDQRHNLVLKFVPKARSVMSIVVTVLILTGIGRLMTLHFTGGESIGAGWMTVFGVKVLFAATPLAIFMVAPRVLGARSKEGLCCDPDAEGPTFKACGVMTNKGTLMHLVAIGGGWLAVLCSVILTQMR